MIHLLTFIQILSKKTYLEIGGVTAEQILSPGPVPKVEVSQSPEFIHLKSFSMKKNKKIRSKYSVVSLGEVFGSYISSQKYKKWPQ